MTILIENHGKKVIGKEDNDLKRAEEIFKNREAIYYSDPKKAKPEVISNWKHLIKVFPDGAITENPMQMYLRDEREIN